MISETPRFVGRAVAALAADPDGRVGRGRSLSSGELAKVYGFTDVDGSARRAWRYVAEVQQQLTRPTLPAIDRLPRQAVAAGVDLEAI